MLIGLLFMVFFSITRRRSNSSSSSSSSAPTRPLGLPLSVLTDSYKASHFLMYPEAELMVAYGEFRGNFQKDKTDSRFIFYGMRYIIENFVAVRWTEEDVEQADEFYRTHGAGFTPFPFPKDLFLEFVRENGTKSFIKPQNSSG